MEAHWPVLPGLTKMWGQRSFKVISDAWKNGVKLAYSAISEYLEEQAGPYFRGHSRSLRGHYEVTSGLIKHAPFELKFDVNDPYNNLNI